MTRAELLREVLLGRLLIVGEFRGAHASLDGYVDRTTGEKVGYVKAIILAECQVRGNLARAMFYQRLPEIVEKPEEAVFPYQKGKLYVFFLVSLKNDNGKVIGSLSDRPPELLQDQPEEEGTVGAPSGAPMGTPNLVNIKNKHHGPLAPKGAALLLFLGGHSHDAEGRGVAAHVHSECLYERIFRLKERVMVDVVVVEFPQDAAPLRYRNRDFNQHIWRVMRHAENVFMGTECPRFVLARPFSCDRVPCLLREVSSVGSDVRAFYRNLSARDARTSWTGPSRIPLFHIYVNGSALGFDLITGGKISGNVW